MFDRDNNGTVDVHAFTKLFEYVNQWLNIFKTYDRNGSGQIDDQELNQGSFWITLHLKDNDNNGESVYN